MKRALVCGAGGFIGSWLVKRLVSEGYYVVGADLKRPEFSPTAAQEFKLADLRNPFEYDMLFLTPFDEVYQLAADMGGSGYVFTGEHDADILTNSALINLNVLKACKRYGAGKIFYSSSACIYPARNQVNPHQPVCVEDSAYPAAPDSEYGWEKLFSERLYQSYARNYKLDVRIARFHNIFGPEGTWKGGKEKAPAAMCRKIAEAPDYSAVEIWGDGRQTRSFLYIDECIEAVRRLMKSDFVGPVNIGSDEMVTINELFEMVKGISKKHYLVRRHIPGPIGVAGRNSDNRLIQKELNWVPTQTLFNGLQKTYKWVSAQVALAKENS